MAGRCHMELWLCSLLLYILQGAAWGQMTEDYDWGEKNCPEENTPMMVTEVIVTILKCCSNGGHASNTEKKCVSVGLYVTRTTHPTGSDIARPRKESPAVWLTQESDSSIARIQVPWGVPGRAYKTLPHGLVIAPSKIPGAGFGVLSETFIPRYTWLGVFDGEIVGVKDVEHVSPYTWQVHRSGEITAYLDGFHFYLSSYHRYLNAPTRHRDENVIPAECYGRLYHLTSRDIVPGDELLIYYGHSNTVDLGIDFNLYFEVPKEFQDGGLDLNQEKQRMSVNRAGVDLFQVKYLPLSWLSKFSL